MNDNDKLDKYVSLFEDIRAADIMTDIVTTLPPDKKISQAKEMMKIKRISGIPVIDGARRLIGLVTIEDIINALEYGRINEPIGDLMTRDVVSLRPDDRLRDIVNKFRQFHFRRFPVVDEDNVLRGIISRTDILNGVLDKFDLIYAHDQKRSSILDSGFSIVTGRKLTADGAGFRYSIETNNIDTAGTGAALLKEFLSQKSYPAEVVRRVGVSTYEAETNVVIHSHGAGDIFCYLQEDMIMVRVVDDGVGIEDMEMAMKEGFSTAPDYVREQGFGAGMGITNMKRFCDKLVILSKKNAGTKVEMIHYLPGPAESRA